MSAHKSIYKRPLRTMALVLVACLGIQDPALASPDLGKALQITLPHSAFHLGLPESVASVDHVQAEGARSPRIFLIRDAHTNPSAQFNTARVLEYLADHERVRTVLTEGGSGDLSVAFLKKFGTAEERRQAASAFLRRGEINGAEYLQITSDAEFGYRGVESDALYERSLEDYRKVIKQRRRIRRELAEIRATIDFLKNRIFSRDLAFWLEQRERFERGEITLAKYWSTLTAEAEARQAAPADMRQMQLLRQVLNLESRVNVARAMNELERVSAEWSEEDRVEARRIFGSGGGNGLAGSSGESSAAVTARGLWLKSRLGGSAAAPDLRLYCHYLNSLNKLKPLELMDQAARIEETLLERLAGPSDAKDLLDAIRAERFYRRLYDFALTPEEVDRYRQEPIVYDMERVLGFLNREVMKAGGHAERTIFLEPAERAAYPKAVEFYELAQQRDEAFIYNALKFVSAEGPDKAALITGGFHTPHLEELLRRNGIPYAVITPRVYEETDQARYEKLLFRPTTLSTSTLMPPGVRNTPTLFTLGARLGASEPDIRAAMATTSLTATAARMSGSFKDRNTDRAQVWLAKALMVKRGDLETSITQADPSEIADRLMWRLNRHPDELRDALTFITIYRAEEKISQIVIAHTMRDVVMMSIAESLHERLRGLSRRSFIKLLIFLAGVMGLEIFPVLRSMISSPWDPEASIFDLYNLIEGGEFALGKMPEPIGQYIRAMPEVKNLTAASQHSLYATGPRYGDPPGFWQSGSFWFDVHDGAVERTIQTMMRDPQTHRNITRSQMTRLAQMIMRPDQDSPFTRRLWPRVRHVIRENRDKVAGYLRRIHRLVRAHVASGGTLEEGLERSAAELEQWIREIEGIMKRSVVPNENDNFDLRQDLRWQDDGGPDLGGKSAIRPIAAARMASRDVQGKRWDERVNGRMPILEAAQNEMMALHQQQTGPGPEAPKRDELDGSGARMANKRLDLIQNPWLEVYFERYPDSKESFKEFVASDDTTLTAVFDLVDEWSDARLRAYVDRYFKRHMPQWNTGEGITQFRQLFLRPTRGIVDAHQIWGGSIANALINLENYNGSKGEMVKQRNARRRAVLLKINISSRYHAVTQAKIAYAIMRLVEIDAKNKSLMLVTQSDAANLYKYIHDEIIEKIERHAHAGENAIGRCIDKLKLLRKLPQSAASKKNLNSLIGRLEHASQQIARTGASPAIPQKNRPGKSSAARMASRFTDDQRRMIREKLEPVVSMLLTQGRETDLLLLERMLFREAGLVVGFGISSDVLAGFVEVNAEDLRRVRINDRSFYLGSYFPVSEIYGQATLFVVSRGQDLHLTAPPESFQQYIDAKKRELGEQKSSPLRNLALGVFNESTILRDLRLFYERRAKFMAAGSHHDNEISYLDNIANGGNPKLAIFLIGSATVLNKTFSRETMQGHFDARQRQLRELWELARQRGIITPAGSKSVQETPTDDRQVILDLMSIPNQAITSLAQEQLDARALFGDDRDRSMIEEQNIRPSDAWEGAGALIEQLTELDWNDSKAFLSMAKQKGHNPYSIYGPIAGPDIPVSGYEDQEHATEHEVLQTALEISRTLEATFGHPASAVRLQLALKDKLLQAGIFIFGEGRTGSVSDINKSYRGYAMDPDYTETVVDEAGKWISASVVRMSPASDRISGVVGLHWIDMSRYMITISSYEQMLYWLQRVMSLLPGYQNVAETLDPAALILRSENAISDAADATKWHEIGHSLSREEGDAVLGSILMSRNPQLAVLMELSYLNKFAESRRADDYFGSIRVELDELWAMGGLSTQRSAAGSHETSAEPEALRQLYLEKILGLAGLPGDVLRDLAFRRLQTKFGPDNVRALQSKRIVSDQGKPGATWRRLRAEWLPQLKEILEKPALLPDWLEGKWTGPNNSSGGHDPAKTEGVTPPGARMTSGRREGTGDNDVELFLRETAHARGARIAELRVAEAPMGRRGSGVDVYQLRVNGGVAEGRLRGAEWAELDEKRSSGGSLRSGSPAAHNDIGGRGPYEDGDWEAQLEREASLVKKVLERAGGAPGIDLVMVEMDVTEIVSKIDAPDKDAFVKKLGESLGAIRALGLASFRFVGKGDGELGLPIFADNGGPTVRMWNLEDFEKLTSMKGLNLPFLQGEDQFIPLLASAAYANLLGHADPGPDGAPENAAEMIAFLSRLTGMEYSSKDADRLKLLFKFDPTAAKERYRAVAVKPIEIRTMIRMILYLQSIRRKAVDLSA